MTHIQKRFLLFGTALPILALLIVIPYAKHLAINTIVLLITIVGTHEMAKMIKAAGIFIHVKTVTTSSAILPVITYLIVMGVLPESAILFYFLAAATLILVIPAFTMATVQFKGIIESAASSLLCLIYPGFFLTFIIRFSSFDFASYILIVFMLTVYFNDSFAWFMGVFFGKNSKRNIFHVSPNKSLIGFGGGIIASLFVTICSWFLLHHIFNGPLWSMIFLGLLAGITTILGDLVESGIKRSAGVKDSGSIVMGRGGLLDSIDSLLLTAPVFYYLLNYAIV
ncbi:phosphatidate cytidylyltransferase [Oceanispirochaeta sp.]|jgi:phosphatidate cytidylyltransferase|uniref:phosphatidate cytidylyltransferase n=1 Tax=Oceanispirochaeta sp. TaxID=2035350 RepID=UPI0026150053|nr:phosphatidate cytidylyltransferase [Oceanispirochaeta sp.]MDA3956635.1 phosphatidate cytidylyltransferase [Oceanispirochaeta sp.]